MRQLVDATHKALPRNKIYTFTNYKDDFADFCEVIFPKQDVENSLGEVISKAGLKQLRIAETEKYAHVTYFFNGGKEEEFPGEERILIPSPEVKSYSKTPEMSAFELTESLTKAISSKKNQFICCNYANPDMVGHSGKFDAAIKAVEAIDACLGALKMAVLQAGGAMLITADHGNVEEMFDEANNQPHTQHTTLPVPLVYVGDRQLSLDSGGSLADIAPTMLALMGLAKPAEMTGRSLIKQ